MTHFQDHFSERAAGYAAHRPTYPATLAAFLAEAAPRRARAWEAGCGSGQLSLILGDRFERVIATDPSAAQLAHARPHRNVRYVRAAAEASGLALGIADLVVAAQAAHWFDLTAYYAEARRVGRPDAVVALVTYGRVTVAEAVDPVIRRFYTQDLGPYWPPARRHVDQAYRSLPFPFEPLAAPELEMRADWALADVIGYVETWSAVRALHQARGDAPFAAFRRALALAWGAATPRRSVRWPLTLRVGRVGR
ncbi:MAG TPA: class I SAM-dependent methyltransferase [Gemmatimonadales bacterium]|nr:class I SAM-dependent methyltransferase [Gemmatimonadales bacterium]